MIRIHHAAALAATLVLPACGGESTVPNTPRAAMKNVGGSYPASGSYGVVKFTSATSGEPSKGEGRRGFGRSTERVREPSNILKLRREGLRRTHRAAPHAPEAERMAGPLSPAARG
jgi:hypothetical protein